MEELLYIKDHLSCSGYSSSEECIFKLFRYAEGERLQKKTMAYSSIVFVLEGAISASCGVFYDRLVAEGNMCFFPNQSYVDGVAVKDTLMISCIFSKDVHLCSRFSLENLASTVDLTSLEYDFCVLPIRDRLSAFLHLLKDCLNDGLGCKHFHSSKRSELFLFLRGYYKKEELAMFFYPVISHDMDIKEFVLAHYKRVKNVKALAELANMSSVTFNRHFKKSFGESASQWLEVQKSKDILREIQMTNKTFSEIADEYDFSSAAYFTTFCKRHFGKTAKELRSQHLAEQRK